MRNSSRKLTSLIYCALAIAMVTLSTMLIKVPAIKGYINFGDIFIFSIAVLLGKKAGFAAGAMGSALADLMLGYAIYAPGTFVIKGLEGLICGIIAERLGSGGHKTRSLAIGTACGALVMVTGYLLYETVIFGFPVGLASIPGNLLQGGVSAVAAVPVILAIKKTGINFSTEG
jgi:uncharacterized membrane protein